MQTLDSYVTVKGTEYRIIKKTHAGSAGSKFFGKYRFTLIDRNGNKFTAFGKTVGGNSKLTPVEDN